jgi:hypothetical protein
MEDSFYLFYIWKIVFSPVEIEFYFSEHQKLHYPQKDVFVILKIRDIQKIKIKLARI